MFDLCSGAGTGFLAASYLGYEAVAVDTRASMNQHAVFRMYLAPKLVHEVLGAQEIVFDNFSMAGHKFKKPKIDDPPMWLKGTCIQYYTRLSPLGLQILWCPTPPHQWQLMKPKKTRTEITRAASDLLAHVC